MKFRVQDTSLFRVPSGFRGRSALSVQLWWLVQSSLFRLSPQIAYGWRRWLLRAFGAKVGAGALIRGSATITYPWNVEIGVNAWVGDDVVLYSLGHIKIGACAVVSQRSYLCAGDHDFQQRDFPIRSAPIRIEPQVWVAADVFIAPGVCIGEGAVIGARSSVFSDMPSGMVCFGYPCKPMKRRLSTSDRGAGALMNVDAIPLRQTS
jgi:putative colanic acid biosynthesis acetyltransferase WcaF